MDSGISECSVASLTDSRAAGAEGEGEGEGAGAGARGGQGGGGSQGGSRGVIILYTDIKDVTQLPPAENGALVDLTYVVSYPHLESALYRVLYNKEVKGFSFTGGNTLSSNICYALSSSKNVPDTQKKYIPSSTTSSAAYLLIDPSDDYLSTLKGAIASQALAVEVMEEIDFMASLMTTEKVAELAAVFKLSPHELKIGSLEDAILMKIAVKESV